MGHLQNIKTEKQVATALGAIASRVTAEKLPRDVIAARIDHNNILPKLEEAPEVVKKEELDVVEARNQRIQAMRERNARNREVLNPGEDDTPMVDEKPATTLHSTPSSSHARPAAPVAGPVSLNSLAGQTALSQLNAHKRDSPGVAPIAPGSRGHTQSLGEITIDDAKLVLWRDDAMEWNDIVPLFERDTGTRRCSDTLRKRYRQVRNALVDLECAYSLLIYVAKGDFDARQRLNRIVHGVWPVPKPTSCNDRYSQSLSRPLTVAESRDPRDHRDYAKTLGEITPQDIRIVRWRDQGMMFKDVANALLADTGIKRHANTLNSRYLVVKPALRSAGVSNEILDRVVEGDAHARTELNTLVSIANSPREQSGPGRGRPRNASQVTRTKDLPSDGLPERPSLMRRASCPYVQSDCDDEEAVPGIDWSVSSSDTLCSSIPRSVRPTTGGKAFDETTFRYILEGMAAAAKEEADENAKAEVDDTEREQSPFTDQDYCHFVYQVQRREIKKEEAEKSVEIDSMPWVDYGNPCDSLVQANTRAANIALRPQNPATADAVGEGECTLTSRRDENGLRNFHLSTEMGGSMQVRVSRSMRTFKDGILPHSKDDWAPKTVYFVKERITTAVGGDDLFEGVEETVQEMDVENQIYTVLEMANEKAVDHYVKKTVKPSTANYVARAAVFKEAKEKLLEELEEEGEDVMFSKTFQESGRCLEVQVEAGRLLGPRNL